MLLCFICGTVLANSSVFPEKLSHHLPIHKDLKAKDEHFWEKSENFFYYFKSKYRYFCEKEIFVSMTFFAFLMGVLKSAHGVAV